MPCQNLLELSHGTAELSKANHSHFFLNSQIISREKTAFVDDDKKRKGKHMLALLMDYCVYRCIINDKNNLSRIFDSINGDKCKT